MQSASDLYQILLRRGRTDLTLWRPILLKLNFCHGLVDHSSLQAIQNALARAVTKTPKHHHITPVLKKLHWLKIPERIEYKVISLTYNMLQSSQPSYLRQLSTIQPPRSTSSSSNLTLLRPSVPSSLKFYNRPTAVAVPTLEQTPPSIATNI